MESGKIGTGYYTCVVVKIKGQEKGALEYLLRKFYQDTPDAKLFKK